MPWDNSRTQQEEERLLFFPGKDSANDKPSTLFTIAPANSLPLFISILLPLLCWHLHVACHGCRSQIAILLIVNKSIFAGEICGSLSVQVNSLHS